MKSQQLSRWAGFTLFILWSDVLWWVVLRHVMHMNPCVFIIDTGRVDREMSGLEAQNLSWCLPGCDVAAMDCFSYSSDTNVWVKSLRCITQVTLVIKKIFIYIKLWLFVENVVNLIALIRVFLLLLFCLLSFFIGLLTLAAGIQFISFWPHSTSKQTFNMNSLNEIDVVILAKPCSYQSVTQLLPRFHQRAVSWKHIQASEILLKSSFFSFFVS